MNKFLKFSILSVCLSVSSLSYAEDASLIVTNNIKSDYNVEIKMDTLCGKGTWLVDQRRMATRWTNELAENPVAPSQVKAATWKNCMPVKSSYFAKDDDHSAVIVRVRNIKTGSSSELALHIPDAQDSGALKFEDKIFHVTIKHDGDYFSQFDHEAVDVTHTFITVDDA